MYTHRNTGSFILLVYQIKEQAAASARINPNFPLFCSFSSLLPSLLSSNFLTTFIFSEKKDPLGSPNRNNDHAYHPHASANSAEASPLDMNQQTQQQQGAYFHQQPVTPASQVEASPPNAALAYHPANLTLPPTTNPDASPNPAFAATNLNPQLMQPGSVYQYQPMTPASNTEDSPTAANVPLDPCQQQPAPAEANYHDYGEISPALGAPLQQVMSPLHQQQMASPGNVAASSPGGLLGNHSHQQIQQQMNGLPQQTGSPFSATPSHNGHHQIQDGKRFQILNIK